MAFMIDGQNRRKTLAGLKTIHKSHKSLKQNTLNNTIYLFTLISVKVYSVDCLFFLFTIPTSYLTSLKYEMNLIAKICQYTLKLFFTPEDEN